MLSPKTFTDIIEFSEDNYIKDYGELIKTLYLKNKKRWLRLVLSNKNKELFYVYFNVDDITD